MPAVTDGYPSTGHHSRFHPLTHIKGVPVHWRPTGPQVQDVPVILTLSAREAAEELGWLSRDGNGLSERIYALYRAGRFPPPIDPELPPRSWRWSRRVVEQYAAGEYELPRANAS